ncbi:putative O-methyltransferase YrrM [Silvimonas terrae]|uniref:Putative O-methyltransferase YrrM n=1 Tax=Silvimonas terrae TaxID=300266 RepID=A0A840REL7_9NEIS|nr:O-methyltransferase [Silvimonas terrae]MBB5191775.1 putative O-methyltransferase YrrM [Silvimonas terrae]
MNTALQNLKAELEQFGEANDSQETGHGRRMLNITRDTGEFLAVMVLATAARRILEIGTSNGYSTLWLAQAAQTTGGLVTTLEYAEDKVAMASANFARAGLAAHINQVHDDAGRYLAEAHPASCDLVFLDSDRQQYAAWWPVLARVLRPGGVLIVDNFISHKAEMADFYALIKIDTAFETSIVPVGKGELIAVKHPD